MHVSEVPLQGREKLKKKTTKEVGAQGGLLFLFLVYFFLPHCKRGVTNEFLLYIGGAYPLK